MEHLNNIRKTHALHRQWRSLCEGWSKFRYRAVFCWNKWWKWYGIRSAVGQCPEFRFFHHQAMLDSRVRNGLCWEIKARTPINFPRINRRHKFSNRRKCLCSFISWIKFRGTMQWGNCWCHYPDPLRTVRRWAEHSCCKILWYWVGTVVHGTAEQMRDSPRDDGNDLTSY